jgi:polar amino acid transport system permease protein
VDLIRSFFDLELLWDFRGRLLEGLLTTIELAVVAFAVSLLPGLLIALARRYGPHPLNLALLVVVSMVRSVPAIVSVVFIFFALPFVGITLSAFMSVVSAIAVVQAIYLSEVFRGALAAVDPGQFEAARAIGLRTGPALRRVILPQAAVVAAPTFISANVQLVQNTTIAVAVGLGDLLSEALDIQTETGNPSPLLAAALLYLLLLLPPLQLAKRYTARADRAR